MQSWVMFPHLLYFNSIKVRLKLSLMILNLLLTSFQFHKGTIKTSASVNPVAAPSAFQFHKGTIKTIPGMWY